MRTASLSALLLALPLVACKKVEPAPKELDELLHWFLSEHDSAEDETAAEAFRNLDAEIDGANLEEHWDGSMSALTKDEVDGLGPSGVDPANAPGIFMVNPVACTLDQLVELVTAKNQIELYETYETYERTWVSDVPAFRDGGDDLAEWDETFTVSVLGIEYAADTIGLARRVADLDDEQTPWGSTLMTRRTMPERATFDNDRDYYDQDYRAEMYYERKNGTVVHVAAMWREASFAGLDSTNEGTQRLVLNGMKDWDDLSEEHCAEMR
jgi:hypothetical protein